MTIDDFYSCLVRTDRALISVPTRSKSDGSGRDERWRGTHTRTSQAEAVCDT